MTEGNGRSASDKAVEKVRPLSATMARQLEKLIENDYKALRQELNQLAADEQERREKEIRARATQDDIDAIHDDADDLVAEYNRRVRELEREARDQGLTLTMPTIQTHNVQRVKGQKVTQSAVRVTDERVEQEVIAMRGQVQKDLVAAMTSLNRAEITAKRQVLLAAITSDAEAVLAGIPSAQAILTQAAADRAAKELEEQQS